jgi:hypothetical protein
LFPYLNLFCGISLSPLGLFEACDHDSNARPDFETTFLVTFWSRTMKRNWTKNEDGILLDMVAQHGKQWGFIASRIPDRTPSQVAARWEKCLDPSITKGPFTAEEDQAIVNFVAQNGPRSWPRVTSLLPNRSAKQCRERWFNHLDPSVVKSEWTQQEDELIFDQYEKQGGKWSTIVKLFPGRTDNAIKNRWNSSVSKRIQVGENGVRCVLPDSSKRKYKPRERPSPTSAPALLPIQSPVVAEPPTKHAPPPLQIPKLQVPSSSGISPTIPFTPFSLPTPVFPGTEGLFSPNSPITGFQLSSFGGIPSPTRTAPFLLSPSKRNLEENFK